MKRSSKFLDYSDEQLVALCQLEIAQRSEAFDILIGRHQAQIYRLCLRYLRQPDDAEEISQEVFIRAFRSIQQFAGRAGFRSWLYRIAINQCFSLLEQRKRTWVSADLIPIDNDDESADGWYAENVHLDTQVADDIDRDEIDKVLEQLTPRDREIITLRFFQDCSLEEIAVKLNTRLSATKMRLYRALERFQSHYQSFAC